MKGFPKHIATKADIEHLLGYLGTSAASDENKTKGLAFLNGLISKQTHYVFDRVLGAEEPADGSEPAYKVMEDQGAGGDERHQFIQAANPDARIHKLGITEAEAQGWITQIEGAQ